MTSCFWFWVRRSPEPAVYFCRHDQFSSSVARQVLPVEPEWLIDALGVATLDPAGDHTGPVAVGQGRLRVETRLPHPEGDFRRVMIIDDARGWVLEQHLYDPAGQLLASATMSGHRRDPLANVILPKSVKIVWPATKFEMTIELNTVAVNQMAGDPQQMWSMPNFGAATPPVNLADPNLRLTPAQPVPPPPGDAIPSGPRCKRPGRRPAGLRACCARTGHCHSGLNCSAIRGACLSAYGGKTWHVRRTEGVARGVRGMLICLCDGKVWHQKAALAGFLLVLQQAES